MTDRNRTFIFAPTQIETATRIAHMIDHNVIAPGLACTLCTDPDNVRTALASISHQRCFAVLLAATRQELELMVSMAPWFEGINCILMVPDHLRKTIALAHRLRPRYLMWPDVNFREMRMVLRNIFARQIDAFRRSSKMPLLLYSTRPKRCFLIRRNTQIIQPPIPIGSTMIPGRRTERRQNPLVRQGPN